MGAVTRRDVLVGLGSGVAVISLAQLAQAVRRGVGGALVNVLEPIGGPWHNDNNWGDQYNGAFPGEAGQSIAVLPKNARLYGPPAVHSVNLFRNDNSPAQNADVYARVTYGCGGVNNSFDCDWLHGSQFSIVCNTVNIVAVTYRPTDQDPYNAADGFFFLGAAVAKGSTTRGAPLTFTTQRARIAAAGAHTFPVVDFARRVTACIGPNNNDNPANPTNVTLGFQTRVGTEIVQYDAQVCAGNAMVAVPGGTTSIIVRTPAARDVALVWELGL